jgi:hypothetical protein
MRYNKFLSSKKEQIMQKTNTLCADGVTLKVNKKHLPFGNTFVQHSVLVQEEPDEVQAYVVCTATSREPGRIYFVAYNKADGALLECYTIN